MSRETERDTAWKTFLRMDTPKGGTMFDLYFAGWQARAALDGGAVSQDVNGWKLVPVTATDEMTQAAWDSDATDYVGEHQRIHNAGDAYRAMIEAAPNYRWTSDDEVDCGGVPNQYGDQLALEEWRRIAKARLIKISYLQQEISALRTSQRDGGAVSLDAYDAGLLNDYGGGNVDWWQDYLRAELGRAHEFYQLQTAALRTPPQQQDEAQLVAFGNWLGEKWRDKTQAQFGQWPMEAWVQDFLAAEKQETNNG